MDLSHLWSTNPGVVVGGVWAVYEVARYVTQNRRNGAQQAVVDRHTNALITGLQKAVDDASNRAATERERADRLMVENMSLHADLGSTRSNLAHEIDNRTRAEARALELQGTVEALVLEARNKDKSILSLTKFNRELLHLMKPSTDALAPASPLEIGNGSIEIQDGGTDEGVS